MSRLTVEQKNTFQQIRKALDGYIPKIAESASEINDNLVIIRQWKAGNYAIGDVRMYEGIPYKCVQAHDSTDNDAWNPTVASLWMQYHGTSVETARPWLAPTGSHDMYKAGEYMIYTDGLMYKCLVDTVYAPADYASAWESVV